MKRLFEKRAAELAQRYQGRIHSWDVVNESATDFSRGLMVPGDAICKSHYGLMPGITHGRRSRPSARSSRKT